MTSITNTTKANVIAAVNALLGLAIVFGVNLTADQTGAIVIAVNAVLSLYVGLTYKSSAKRIPDEGIATITLDPNNDGGE